MQKFGLRAGFSGTPNSIELAIAKEQASALGRAGKKLRMSLERYQLLLDGGADINRHDTTIREISENVWALLLQREFVGFTDENLDWVEANYVIPREAIAMLGIKRS